MGRQGITRQAPLAAGAGAYLAPLLGGGPIDDLAEQLGLQESDNASVYDERRYGIPLDMHPLALYYDKGC